MKPKAFPIRASPDLQGRPPTRNRLKRKDTHLKLTENEVRYVASLANLNLTDEEIDRMVHDLGSILEHMDRLAGIDTEGVEPMTQVLYETGETATLRPDVERAPLEEIGGARECAGARQRLFQGPESDRAMTARTSIQSIREGLLRKEFSAVEIAREALAYAERENPKTNAYLLFSPSGRWRRRNA